MAISLYGCKDIINMLPRIFLFWSLCHKPVRFVLPRLACGVNRLNEEARHTHDAMDNVCDWQKSYEIL